MRRCVWIFVAPNSSLTKVQCDMLQVTGAACLPQQLRRVSGIRTPSHSRMQPTVFQRRQHTVSSSRWRRYISSSSTPLTTSSHSRRQEAGADSGAFGFPVAQTWLRPFIARTGLPVGLHKSTGLSVSRTRSKHTESSECAFSCA